MYPGLETAGGHEKTGRNKIVHDEGNCVYVTNGTGELTGAEVYIGARPDFAAV